MKENYEETFKKLTWCFPLQQFPHCGQDYVKQIGAGTSYQSLFGLQKNVKKNSFFCDLSKFDDLIQSGFWFISNNIFINVCKPVHDVIIIPVSSDHLNLTLMEKYEKIEFLIQNVHHSLSIFKKSSNFYCYKTINDHSPKEVHLH